MCFSVFLVLCMCVFFDTISMLGRLKSIPKHVFRGKYNTVFLVISQHDTASAWLRSNPLAVDIAHTAARQSTAAKGAQEDRYNFMDSALVLSVTVALIESGTLRGNFTQLHATRGKKIRNIPACKPPCTAHTCML